MPVGVALIKITRNNNGKKMGKGIEKRQSSYIVGGTVPVENTRQIPQKTMNTTNKGSSYSISGYLSK